MTAPRLLRTLTVAAVCALSLGCGGGMSFDPRMETVMPVAGFGSFQAMDGRRFAGPEELLHFTIGESGRLLTIHSLFPDGRPLRLAALRKTPDGDSLTLVSQTYYWKEMRAWMPSADVVRLGFKFSDMQFYVTFRVEGSDVVVEEGGVYDDGYRPSKTTRYEPLTRERLMAAAAGNASARAAYAERQREEAAAERERKAETAARRQAAVAGFIGGMADVAASTRASAPAASSRPAAAAPGASATARTPAPAASDAPSQAVPPGKPLSFMLLQSVHKVIGGRNASCYSNVVTVPGPPGWGHRGLFSTQPARDLIAPYQERFREACAAQAPVTNNPVVIHWNSVGGEDAPRRTHADYQRMRMILIPM